MQCLHRPHRTSCRYLHGKYQTMKTKCVIVEFGAKIIINQQCNDDVQAEGTNLLPNHRLFPITSKHETTGQL